MDVSTGWAFLVAALAAAVAVAAGAACWTAIGDDTARATLAHARTSVSLAPDGARARVSAVPSHDHRERRTARAPEHPDTA